MNKLLPVAVTDPGIEVPCSGEPSAAELALPPSYTYTKSKLLSKSNAENSTCGLPVVHDSTHVHAVEWPYVPPKSPASVSAV